MPKIVCFGEALIDLLAQLPAAAGTPPRAFLQYAAGGSANVAVAAALSLVRLCRINTGVRTQTTYGALDASMPALLALGGDLDRAKRL